MCKTMKLFLIILSFLFLCCYSTDVMISSSRWNVLLIFHWMDGRPSRNVWTKLLPLDLKDRYTALLGVPESHLLDDGVYTCQVLISSCTMSFTRGKRRRRRRRRKRRIHSAHLWENKSMNTRVKVAWRPYFNLIDSFAPSGVFSSLYFYFPRMMLLLLLLSYTICYWSLALHFVYDWTTSWNNNYNNNANKTMRKTKLPP